ncbi:hypothetical protein [Pikeienuella sp. HZG-20]|uniref:hypothetical protein n=1 Tax=Paludibacillus litoralis TaxID=3133267 RepID=UPI0030EC9545
MPDDPHTEPLSDDRVTAIEPLGALTAASAGGAATDGLSVEWLLDRLFTREDRS